MKLWWSANLPGPLRLSGPLSSGGGGCAPILVGLPAGGALVAFIVGWWPLGVALAVLATLAMAGWLASMGGGHERDGGEGR